MRERSYPIIEDRVLPTVGRRLSVGKRREAAELSMQAAGTVLESKLDHRSEAVRDNCHTQSSEETVHEAVTVTAVGHRTNRQASVRLRAIFANPAVSFKVVDDPPIGRYTTLSP